jgi:hypothetical protein
MSTRERPSAGPLITILASAAALSLGGLAQGCGSTNRDRYYLARNYELPPAVEHSPRPVASFDDSLEP